MDVVATSVPSGTGGERGVGDGEEEEEEEEEGYEARVKRKEQDVESAQKGDCHSDAACCLETLVETENSNTYCVRTCISTLLSYLISFISFVISLAAPWIMCMQLILWHLQLILLCVNG